MKTYELLKKLGKKFPKKIAKKYHDPVGLQTGKLKEDVSCIFLALDFDEIAFKFLEDNNLLNKIDLIITHHPFIFGKKKKVFEYDENKRILCEKIDAHNIPIYSFHTNFDEGIDGMNDALANELNLSNVKPLFGDPMARGGDLEFEMPVVEFAKYAKNKLKVDYGLLLDYGKPKIKKVAIVGGGGWHSFRIAQNEDYDIFISGDMPHHARREVISYKFNYLDLPHEIEKIFMEQMKMILLEINPSLEIISLDHEVLPKVI